MVNVFVNMKKLILAVLFIICTSPAWGATTYYVDATDGLDTNDGLSEGGAWKTIAKVNGAAFVAGDTILFQRGEEWGERLNVPASGSDGLPITFGAYGTGADPILDANGEAYVFNIGDNDYITVSGLKIVGGTARQITNTRPSSHIIISDMVLEDGADNAIMLGNGGAGTITDITIDNVTITDVADQAIIVENFTDLTITDCTISVPLVGDGVGKGIFIPVDGNVGTLTIARNTITGTESIGIELGDQTPRYPTGTIVVEHNVISGCPQSGLEDFGSNAIYRYNRVTNCDAHGIFIRDTSTAQVIGNIVYDNAWSGIRVQDGTVGVKVYNNTLYQNNTANNAYDAEICVDNTATTPTGTLIKNNIMYHSGSNKALRIEDAIGAGTVVDYNSYDSDYTAMISWAGDSYNTLAAFNTAETPQEDHGVSADPLFANAAGDDFTLQYNSPCEDAGDNTIGAAYDDGLDPRDTTVPYSTLDQDLYGSGWEIGAFVYTGGLTGIAKDWDGNIMTSAVTVYVFEVDGAGAVVNQGWEGSGTSNTTTGIWMVDNIVEDEYLVVYVYYGAYGSQTNIAGAKYMQSLDIGL